MEMLGGGGEKGCGEGCVPQSAPLISAPTLSLKKPVEKKEPHSGVLAAFLGSRQGKLYAENSLGLKAIDDH